MAAPTILDKEIIDMFDSVVSHDINAIIMTDEELVLMVNERLPESKRFSYKAFQDWKAHSMGFASKDGVEPLPQSALMYEELRGVYKKALMKQKSDLFYSLRADDKAWQRYAWIIERKFSDWNLRNISHIGGVESAQPVDRLTLEIINRQTTKEELETLSDDEIINRSQQD